MAEKTEATLRHSCCEHKGDLAQDVNREILAARLLRVTEEGELMDADVKPLMTSKQ